MDVVKYYKSIEEIKRLNNVGHYEVYLLINKP